MYLNKNVTYTYDGYTYKNFISLSDDELIMILGWRNHPDSRKCMNNTTPIPIEDHLAFCHNLKNRDDVCYWMISKDSQPTGVLDIIDIDYQKEQCEPGFYLSTDILGRGESIYVLSNYKDFLLNGLGFKGLIGHNYVDNMPAMVFTMFFGGRVIGHEIKNDRLCVKTILTKETFVNGIGTERLTAKYARYYREWDNEKFINSL